MVPLLAVTTVAPAMIGHPVKVATARRMPTARRHRHRGTTGAASHLANVAPRHRHLRVIILNGHAHLIAPANAAMARQPRHAVIVHKARVMVRTVAPLASNHAVAPANIVRRNT
jgi:hypothetical protein